MRAKAALGLDLNSELAEQVKSNTQDEYSDETALNHHASAREFIALFVRNFFFPRIFFTGCR
jgi:hypothetical protein